jgi:hypothetical protein
MQRVLGLTILSLGILTPAIAPAQAPPRPPKTQAMEAQKAHTDAGYVKRFEFDNDEVTGTFVGPEEVSVDGRGKAKHKSLVQPRLSFVPELIKSARGI